MAVANLRPRDSKNRNWFFRPIQTRKSHTHTHRARHPACSFHSKIWMARWRNLLQFSRDNYWTFLSKFLSPQNLWRVLPTPLSSVAGITESCSDEFLILLVTKDETLGSLGAYQWGNFVDSQTCEVTVQERDCCHHSQQLHQERLQQQNKFSGAVMRGRKVTENDFWPTHLWRCCSGNNFG